MFPQQSDQDEGAEDGDNDDTNESDDGTNNDQHEETDDWMLLWGTVGDWERTCGVMWRHHELRESCCYLILL